MRRASRQARWRRRIGVIALAACLAQGAVSLGAAVTPASADDDDEAANIAHAPVRVTIRNGISILTLSAAEQQNAGIVTALPMPAPTQRVVNGRGAVLDSAAPTELSNRYLDAESAVHIAETKLAVARAGLERAKILHRDEQNVSVAQVQAAQGEFDVDQATLAAARVQQSMIAARARQEWGDVIGNAVVEQAPLIADLVERRRYLVKVTLPPGDTLAEPPEVATAHVDGGTDVQLDFIAPASSADPQLQGLGFFFAAAPQNKLVPGLRLDVSLTVKSTAPGVVVPEAAVVWLQGKAWVFCRTAPTRFERREIQPNRMSADGGYIVSDLPAGGAIVLRGAQMLLSEEFRAQAPIED